MKKKLAIAVPLACVAISLVMFILKPVPGGQGYQYALLLSLAMAALGFLYTRRSGAFFGKAVLAAVLLWGLVQGAANLSRLNPDSELIQHYATLFKTLESGRNPYTAGTLFHHIENSGPVFGNFNYPPLEIFPYYAAYRIAGTWNLAVLTWTIVAIQALGACVLLGMFPGLRKVHLLPFLPMIILGEVRTNSAMTLLLTALILWAIKTDVESPRPWRRYAIAVLFGLGLTTKFLVIPLMAAYYWHRFDSKNLRSLVRIAVDASIAAATAVLIMLPFGVGPVLKNTILFNLILKDRAALTTFWPNVLSGPMTWLGLPVLYPILAVVILGASILVAPKLDLFSAMLAAAFAFLMVAPTPEPQFVPVIFLIVVVAQGLRAETEDRGDARRILVRSGD